jgi:hypothetical protein
MKMITPRRTASIVMLSLVFLSGCTKSDLERDGVIRSGWSIAITDAGPGGRSPFVLAWANDKLAMLVPESPLGKKAQVFLVPYMSGYSVVVLAPHTISPSEREIVDGLVNRALEEASADESRFEKTANKTPQSTTSSVTPPAGQEARQP